MSRKNFSYQHATVAQIAEHFKQSSPQAIYLARRTWKNDVLMSAKVEEAYRRYKIDSVMDKLSGKKSVRVILGDLYGFCAIAAGCCPCSYVR